MPAGLGSTTSPQGNYPSFTSQAPVNPQNLNRYSYVRNNPLVYTDPYGWWTLGIGFNLNFGAGAGGSVSIMLAFDGHGGIAVVYSGGGGGFGGVGGSATVQGQWTSADRVQDLSGVCVQTGGSGGEGLGGGLEWVAAEKYQGVNLNFGLAGGLAPIEMHSNIEVAKVTALRDNQQSKNQLPLSFTATLAQLSNSSYSVGTSAYQGQINQAFSSVYANLGANQMVGWSSDRGYYAIDIGSFQNQSYDYGY